MLHAKAFLRDGEELLAGTCNLEAWSLKRFFDKPVQQGRRRFVPDLDLQLSEPGCRAASLEHRDLVLEEIDVQVWSRAVAVHFEERFATPAEAASAPGRALDGMKARAKGAAFAALSPLL